MAAYIMAFADNLLYDFLELRFAEGVAGKEERALHCLLGQLFENLLSTVEHFVGREDQVDFLL